MTRRRARARVALLTTIGLMGSCTAELEEPGDGANGAAPMDAIAEQYVKLALAFRPYDESYVDAYYGPGAWATEAAEQSIPLGTLHAEAETQLALLRRLDLDGDSEVVRARMDGLDKRYRAMLLRMDMATGQRLAFDEESQALFDATAPSVEESDLRAAITALESIVPGEGALGDRVTTFRDQFTIPPERLADVFDAAIGECRRRTLAHIDLPDDESFTVEYVTDQPWSGYNWYQGASQSLIQINTDLPIYIDRAIDLGCHEGYPGHHTYNVLVEQVLVDDRAWVEFALVPLYGPMSLISEGSANYGIELAFPDAERRAFERDVLFPLANLSTAEIDRYHDVLRALDGIKYAEVGIARDYIDGRLTAAEAVARTRDYALVSDERARQRIRFIDTYRSYVINYSFGRDLVADFLTTRAGADLNQQWREFESLLSRPMSPGLMRAIELQ